MTQCPLWETLLERKLGQRFPQHFYRVQGFATGAIFYLVAAAGAGCCNDHIIGGIAHRRKQYQLANFHAQLVVFFSFIATSPERDVAHLNLLLGDDAIFPAGDIAGKETKTGRMMRLNRPSTADKLRQRGAFACNKWILQDQWGRRVLNELPDKCHTHIHVDTT